jgi:predicted O-methyltransferase YrrM
MQRNRKHCFHALCHRVSGSLIRFLRLKTLATAITEPFDLVFIDADKTSYPAYLSLILSLSTSSAKVRLLRPGGLIIADNILRRGLVADSSDANPWAERGKSQKPWQLSDIQALRDFNRAMVESPRLESFFFALFDGLGMGRLLD